MLNIMLSSTYEDLKKYRKDALIVLNKFKHNISAMEIFDAMPDKPVEVSISTAENADIYIGIVAWRYGTVDENTGKSFTQLEYEGAFKKNKQCLIFLMPEDFNIPAKYVDKGVKGAKLDDFRKELINNHTCRFFTTPEDLSVKIHRSLQKILIKDGYWDKLKELYETRELSDLAPRFNANISKLKLIERIEDDIKGLEKVHEHINNSYERMEEDLYKLLSKLGHDTRVQEVGYWENPFINRDWEMRTMGLHNWTLHIKGGLLQLKVSSLEEEVISNPNNTELSNKLQSTKKELEEFLNSNLME